MKTISYGVSVVLMVLLMAALNASGEYYQYSDPNGSLRFTDDPTLIPAEQMEDARVYESIVSYPETLEQSPSSAENKEVGSPADDIEMKSVDKKKSISSSKSKDRVEVTELNAMREQLKKAYEELEAVRKPGTPVQELNQKNEAYNQRCIEFNEKIKALNS